MFLLRLRPLNVFFCAGGDIITEKKNRLGGKNTRYLLCLRSWGIIPEDDDEDEIEALPEVAEVEEGEESIELSANRDRKRL